MFRRGNGGVKLVDIEPGK